MESESYMQVGVGYSNHPDSMIAGKQAAEMALSKTKKQEHCDLVLLFCTARHNQETLRDSVVAVVGNSQCVFGGGSAGVITNEYFGYAGDQVGIACIWLEDSNCQVLTETGLEKSEIRTGMRLGKHLLKSGVTPNSSVMLFYDAINRTNGEMHLLLATWLLKGLEKGMGFLPDIMGAGLQGDHACSSTKQYTGAGMDAHSVISLSFSDDIRIDSLIMHGCRPASPYYMVTKVDGPVILEINNKPALVFIDEVLKSVIPPENYPFFLLFGINHGERWGAYDESNYASRLCMGIDKERNGIVMFEPDMVEGVEFQIMFRSLELDYMEPKIKDVFAKLDGREPIFAMYIDCAGRCAGYGGIDIEDALVIQKAVGKDIPLLGIYTGVEIASLGGTPRGLDLTGVFCLFSKNKESEKLERKIVEKSVWNTNHSKIENKNKIPLSAILRLCEQNAAKVLALDSKAIAIRHELEQKRRGFSLLAELSVSLRENSTDEDIFLLVTQRINSALNMQKTVVLFPDINGNFLPYILQGYNVEEQEEIIGQQVEINEELLNPEQPVLITAIDDVRRLSKLREVLKIPYFISAPIIVNNEVAAILITGRMVELVPFLSRLGRSDAETVQAISSLLASILVYRKLDDANKKAQRDVLTGLFNRGALKSQATKSLQKYIPDGKRFAFMIIDCDYFKEVNDSYGHMGGDMVLNTLACFLQENFRADDCVARIGGDEFAVFCSLTDNDSEQGIFNKTVQLVKSWSEFPLAVKGGLSFYSTVSVGISFAARDGITYDELFHAADIALYKSKELGRNQCTVYDAKSMGNENLSV